MIFEKRDARMVAGALHQNLFDGPAGHVLGMHDPLSAMAALLTEDIVSQWKRSANAMALPVFGNIEEWDNMLRKGGPLFHRVRGHKAKVKLFAGLTPEVAALVRERVPEAVERVWKVFELLCPTWYLAG